MRGTRSQECKYDGERRTGSCRWARRHGMTRSQRPFCSAFSGAHSGSTVCFLKGCMLVLFCLVPLFFPSGMHVVARCGWDSTVLSSPFPCRALFPGAQFLYPHLLMSRIDGTRSLPAARCHADDPGALLCCGAEGGAYRRVAACAQRAGICMHHSFPACENLIGCVFEGRGCCGLSLLVEPAAFLGCLHSLPHVRSLSSTGPSSSPHPEAHVVSSSGWRAQDGALRTR
ncbi:hypothetical protein FA95DRAFT_545775 [Auriscalpium vulgare]|uniref:Uncharacterized protein n=1 Tax=Auriscalpium vulgare TaxID=40419 RepID=A0ACB8RF28_9AGAM|nr:hypothetical protein FA95DRAFT_545775 [Auriscalpium vulgare]